MKSQIEDNASINFLVAETIVKTNEIIDSMEKQNKCFDETDKAMILKNLDLIEQFNNKKLTELEELSGGELTAAVEATENEHYIVLIKNIGDDVAYHRLPINLNKKEKAVELNGGYSIDLINQIGLIGVVYREFENIKSRTPFLNSFS